PLILAVRPYKRAVASSVRCSTAHQGRPGEGRGERVGRSFGRGAPRGGGSNGRRRRGGGPVGRSGAAPQGAGVQASGDGGRGNGWSVGRGAPRSTGSSSR